MIKDELILKTNKAISELVYDKEDLQKAYNYYNGIRDAEQFRYLEENFGIGNPTSIEFTPVVRKHIDALVGEILGNPIIPKIQCKDTETINSIEREKLLKITKEIHLLLTNNLKKSILEFVNKKDTTDPLIAELIKKLVEGINDTFRSLYEIAALNILEYILLSRATDFLTVLRELAVDLLVTGTPYYKVIPTVENTNIKIVPLSPLNVFPDVNLDSPYVKDSYRIVVRYWYTRTLILNKYGRELTGEDRKLLEELWETQNDSSSYAYVKPSRYTPGDVFPGTVIQTPGMPPVDDRMGTKYIPVYEVEWLETDKNFVMQRYETVRIGDEIFILRGRNDNVIRSKDNPNYCCLSVNGVLFFNRGNKPYSLMLQCANLQDKYDILGFYRDRLVASSGTTGDFVDVSLLPTFLGKNMPERLQKFIAYKKGGIAPIDSSQPGRMENGGAAPNTIFNGFDDTLSVQAILAILLTMQLIEETISSITGVFRERLNGIEAKDAVTNIKVGLQNSFIITKLIYHLIDLIISEMLLDCLNLAKVVYKNGLTGTIILGEKLLKVFTALPEFFTLTDYDIRIVTSGEVSKDLETVKLLIPEFIKSNSLAPDIIFDTLTSKSLAEIKSKVKLAMKKQKEENNQLQLLSLKLQETELQAKQMQQELEKALKKIEQLNETKIQLEQLKMLMEYKIDEYKARTERTYREALMEEQKRRTDIEILLLSDGNPYNDRIRQIAE